MAGFATVVGLMIIQAFLIGQGWRARMQGENREVETLWVRATVVANCLLGVLAFLAFLAGLGSLAWLASSVITP